MSLINLSLQNHPLLIPVLTVAIVGFSAMTWFFPVLAAFLSLFLKKFGTHEGTAAVKISPLRSIAILLPAHNEAVDLPETLRSIQRSVFDFNTFNPAIKVSIIVAADGCKDNTAEIARSLGVQVIESPIAQGKWKSLTTLIRSAHEADWVVLVDSGTLWSVRLLRDAFNRIQKGGLIGLAPSYRNPNAGIIEKCIWKFESSLKKLENRAGGPIAVHGATVLYERKAALESLDQLNKIQASWLNDDVALALCMRLMNPELSIEYATQILISDGALENNLKENKKFTSTYVRRKRILIGNLQWINLVLFQLLRRNPVAALIAMRRVFRVLWAYWISAFLFAALLFLYANSVSILELLAAVVAVVGMGLLIVGEKPFIGLLEASSVSMLTPYFWFKKQTNSRWK